MSNKWRPIKKWRKDNSHQLKDEITPSSDNHQYSNILLLLKASSLSSLRLEPPLVYIATQWKYVPFTGIHVRVELCAPTYLKKMCDQSQKTTRNAPITSQPIRTLIPNAASLQQFRECQLLEMFHSWGPAPGAAARDLHSQRECRHSLQWHIKWCINARALR